MVVADVAGAAAMIQSDFRSGDHGNFEVVVPLHNDRGGADLWHFFHDNSDVSSIWHKAQMVAADVAGPGSIIQSDFRSSDHGNFEFVVPLRNGRGLDFFCLFFYVASDGLLC